MDILRRVVVESALRIHLCGDARGVNLIAFAVVKFIAPFLRFRKERSDYIAFVDHGAPFKEGKLDVDFIKKFGLKVPDNAILALGDNYAMSADSRDFGFVPIENLRGAPSFTYWPPSKRLGPLPEPSRPWLTLPNLIVWGAVLLVIIIWILYCRKRRQRHYI